jgi:hypothetical protein
MEIGTRVRYVSVKGSVIEGEVCEVIPPWGWPKSPVAASRLRPEQSYVIRFWGNQVNDRWRQVRYRWPRATELESLEVL